MSLWPAGDNSGNSRNGRRAKAMITVVGPVQIAVPWDRDASFEPQLVKKRKTPRSSPTPRAGS
ncbi:transposase [Nonomuraea wenchangensis]|uniref:transposase n=1 Tax=Nonomuraea wenchangensis TaxID=568860 RepID=UPI00384D80F3